MWTLYEPVHVVTYFAPAALQAFGQAGLRGFWRGYFAGRAAPLGPVAAAPVTAAFFSFAPVMTQRALPAVWELISPQQALAVRQAGAVAALRELLHLAGDDQVPAPVAAAADQLASVASGVGIAGRTLAAANAALPVPGEPLARLWHAATVLREHRGDGHIAALVAADVDAPEALVLRTAVVPGTVREQLQPARGWTDGEWAAAAWPTRRGLIGPDGAATTAGRHLHAGMETATDQAAARPWAGLDSGATEELAAALLPVARACAAVLPAGNPVGVPVPACG